jgi:insertion element IS1 protein InsB
VRPGFVLTPENALITEEQRALSERLLLERISLRGIGRAVAVGLQWRLQFMSARFAAAPEDLPVKPTDGTPAVSVQRRKAELEELWSVVGKKANRHWVGIARDAHTRQVIAFHVGDRSGQSAAALWAKIPAGYQQHAVFYTDHDAAYLGVIPSAQHRTISKLTRRTNPVERFNCPLQQRVSRLARSTLSFSKKLANHIGAIKYFICHYNLTKCAALPE